MYETSRVFAQDLVTDEVTAVEVQFAIGGTSFVVKGSAKKHPRDEPADEVGLALAYSRAFLDLAERLADHAQLRIEMNSGVTVEEWLAQRINGDTVTLTRAEVA